MNKNKIKVKLPHQLIDLKVDKCCRAIRELRVATLRHESLADIISTVELGYAKR